MTAAPGLSKPDKVDSKLGREAIARAIKTPLAFFSLVVLVVEAILRNVIGPINGVERTIVIIAMVVLLVCLVGIVTFFAWFRPERLFGLQYIRDSVMSNFAGGRLVVIPKEDAAAQEACLYTICGLDPLIGPRKPPEISLAGMFRLWADPNFAENGSNFIKVEIPKDKHCYRVVFESGTQLFSNATFRPCGKSPMKKNDGDKFLVITVVANGSQEGPLGVAVRLTDTIASQWVYGVETNVQTCLEVPTDGKEHPLPIDLAPDKWRGFDADGNHYYRTKTPDFSYIAAITMEFGKFQNGYLAPGRGNIDIQKFEFMKKAPS